MITKPFNAFEPENLIKEAIKRYGDNLAVACSFGKDSIIVLYMVLKYKPNIKVIFNNTGVEFPETIKYKDKIKKLWNLNLIETTPYKSMTFHGKGEQKTVLISKNMEQQKQKKTQN